MDTIVVIAIFALMLGLGAIYFQLRELHKSTNSRLDELLTATKSLARAEGFKAGQEDHLQALRDFGKK